MSRGEDGYSLIEVIVALAILGSAVAMSYSGLGQSWRAERNGDETAKAIAIGQNVLAGAGSETPLADGQSFSGADGAITWNVRVERYSAPGDGLVDAALVPPAYWLVFAAEWPDAGRRQPHTLELRALRLGGPR